MDFSPAQSYKYVFIWKSYMCIFCAFNTLLSHFVNFDWIYWKFNCASYNPIYIAYYIKRQIRGNNYRDNSNNFFSRNKIFKIHFFIIISKFNSINISTNYYTFYVKCDTIILYSILDVIVMNICYKLLWYW